MSDIKTSRHGVKHIDEHDVSEKPVELEPVLALIETHTELGPQHWFEVVFHDGERWRSYEGSDTFSNGEIVTRWHYADGVFDRPRHQRFLEEPK